MKKMILGISFCFWLPSTIFCNDSNLHYQQNLIQAITKNDVKSVEALWTNYKNLLSETQKNHIKQASVENLDLYKKKSGIITKSYKDIAKITVGSTLVALGIYLDNYALKRPKITRSRQIDPISQEIPMPKKPQQRTFSENTGYYFPSMTSEKQPRVIAKETIFKYVEKEEVSKTSDSKPNHNQNSIAKVIKERKNKSNLSYRKGPYTIKNYVAGILGLSVIGLGFKLITSGWRMTSFQQDLKNAQLIYDIMHS